MTKRLGILLASAGLVFAACGGADDTPTDKGGIDLDPIVAPPKSDIGKRAKIIEDLRPDSTVTGAFDNKVRVYAYVVTASKGATINVSLDAKAGDGGSISPEEELDTILAIYGPYENRSNPGEKLVEMDDEGDRLAAPDINFEVPDEAKYMIVFSSWDTPGEGEYELKLACEGTDFQCRRPELDKPCEDTKMFVQGGEIAEDVEWNACETVVLETPTITPEGTLTIRPGVEVQFNYLGDQDQFGIVGIDAQGALQITGTEEAPVRLTSLKDGWRGISLIGEGHVVQNTFIENTRRAIHLQEEATGSFQDVVMQNQGRIGEGIVAENGSSAQFVRAVAKGFDTGVLSNFGEDIIITDSTITDNNIGLRANGEPSRNITRCGNVPTPPARPFNPDPVITHSDIYNNNIGVQVIGDLVLLQIENSNIVDNTGFALDLQTAELNAESFIRKSNIIGNNGDNNLQVRTFHRRGILDLSGNYWVDISDPELSANWQNRCNGEISFTGFEPEQLDDSGPRLNDLVQDVKDQTWKQTQNQ